MKLSPNTKFTILLFATLMTAAMYGGCAAKNGAATAVHPNQINAFDGQTYDILVSAQAALDEAKLQYKAGKLPTSSKSLINAAGASYETARTSWQTWRDVSLGVRFGDPEALKVTVQADTLALTQAIAEVVKLTGGKQ
jgi:hypothetical protein